MIGKNSNERPIKKFNRFVGWIVSILLILIGFIIMTDSLLKGFLFMLIGLTINPKIGGVINKKFKTKKVRIIAIIILFIITILVLVAYKTEKQVVGTELVGKQMQNLNACDFLPDENIIPTEFKINPSTEDNNSCTQTYIQNSPWTTRFNIKIHKFDTKEETTKKYNELVSAEKSKRGYTELKTTKPCFAVHRELTMYTKVKHYCNWDYLVYEETVYDIELFDSNVLLAKIPQNVADKLI